MWIITKDMFEERGELLDFEKSSVGVTSCNYDGSELKYKFRLKDDDDEIYYYGQSDSNNDEEAFSPLSNFGTPNSGCTMIEYYNTDKKLWELL